MTTFIDENWDTGTPDSNWPGKRLGTACDDGTSFNGWTGRGFACDDTSGANAGLSTTRSHSGTKSFYQERQSGHHYACDLSHSLTGNPTTIYVRFYMYLETGFSSIDAETLTHFFFTNTALSSTGFRLNLLGMNWTGGSAGGIYLDPEGDGGAMWCYSSEDWGDVITDVNYATFIGSWHCFEYKMEISGSNVIFTEWIDGVLSRGPITGPGAEKAYFDKIIISGYSNLAEAYTGAFYIDDIVVSDEYIGPLEETSKRTLFRKS